MIDAYVYRVTNKLTGEFYHGYRYQNQTLGILPENDIWVNYFTSSARIKKEIKKHGKDAFVVEIIYRNTDSIKCWKQEQILIKNDWGNPLLLNGKYHDPESDVEVFRRVNLLTEETRLKMSKAGKGRSKTEDHKKKIAIANTGKKGSAQKSAKISFARKGKSPSNKGVTPPKFKCQHCNSVVSKANFQRWHGNNCKFIDPTGHVIRTAQVAAINRKA